MSDEPSSNQDTVKRYIQDSLRNAEANASRTHTFNTLFLVTSILTAAGTTFVSAVTAAHGPIIGQGPAGWKLSCLIAAIFGFITTACVGINQAFGFAQRLSRTNECAGRLKSLDFSIKTGRSNWDDIATEYEEIAKDFAQEIRR